MNGPAIGHSCRVLEKSDNEAYVNINDLIVEMLLSCEKADSDQEKNVYKDIVKTLIAFREKAHNTKK